MKTIGLLGGMSWESTASYYRVLNEGIKSALGGFHSARIAMVSVDFDEIEKLQHTGSWEQMAQLLAAAAKSVEAAGADSTSVRIRSIRFSTSVRESATDFLSCRKAASLASFTSAKLLETSLP
ncbi:MAG: aspartate/glutamate racemase family protein, partial [Proteobacteria bacterium]|nr:aspartate/glutamate racemase family protein [Pseudomonadota bacterium]